MRRLSVLFLIAAATVPAGEFVRMRNGARIEIDRHEQQGNDVFLYSKQNIQIVDISEIERFESATPPAAAGAAAASAKAQDPDAPPPADTPIHKLINESAERNGVPPRLVHAVANSESRYQQGARSYAGAIGVMQLMPSTARHFGADPYDPAQNIEAGTRFLRELLRRYEGEPNQVELALAAYNAGPGAVDYYGGVPPYTETVRYVQKTMRAYREGAALNSNSR